MKYYPSWVYNPREDITRANMKEYDRKVDTAYEIEKEKEKKIGRKLTLSEIYEIRKELGL